MCLSVNGGCSSSWEHTLIILLGFGEIYLCVNQHKTRQDIFRVCTKMNQSWLLGCHRAFVAHWKTGKHSLHMESIKGCNYNIYWGDTDPQIFYMVKRPPPIYWCKIPKNTSYTTTGSHIKYASIQNNVFLTKPNQLPLSELLVVLPLLIYVMLLIFHVERHLCSEILILKFYFTIWCLSLLPSLSSLSSAFICLSGSNKSTCMLRFCG